MVPSSPRKRSFTTPVSEKSNACGNRTVALSSLACLMMLRMGARCQMSVSGRKIDSMALQDFAN